MTQKSVILIGYSGHAYVAAGIFRSAGRLVTHYCDNTVKQYNPFGLEYLGTETSAEAMAAFAIQDFFIAIGNNSIRCNIAAALGQKKVIPINALHTAAIIDPSAAIATSGVMIAARAVINPLVTIHEGVICNTGCIIEHECNVAAFAHIGPGAVLCGNVQVGRNTFVGAGAVVRQGISIGSNVMIGAGAVVIKDVPDAATVVGNPARMR